MAESEIAKAAPEKVTFHRDRLIAEAGDFFDRPSHVIAGALADKSRSRKLHFTREECERAIKEFDDHVVETSYGGGE